MARLRASEDEVQSLERKLTVTKDELTMIKDQLGPETQALVSERDWNSGWDWQMPL